MYKIHYLSTKYNFLSTSKRTNTLFLVRLQHTLPPVQIQVQDTLPSVQVELQDTFPPV